MIWQLSEDKRWSALRQRFSWVDEMHQVPQDPLHHAEGDVGIRSITQKVTWGSIPEWCLMP
ncbi:hypothetical protein ACUY4Q_001117 [Phytobacter sp. AG2a]